MTLLSFHTMHSTHAPGDIYASWVRPGAWPEWDADVREVRFDGIARVGSRGWMRPASGPATTFEVTVADQDHIFTDVSGLPGASLIFEHIVVPNTDGTTISVAIRLEGLLAPIWKILLGRTFAGAAERNVAGLVAHLDAAAARENA